MKTFKILFHTLTITIAMASLGLSLFNTWAIGEIIKKINSDNNDRSLDRGFLSEENKKLLEEVSDDIVEGLEK